MHTNSPTTKPHSITTNITETTLIQLLEHILAGQEVVLTQAGNPIATLIPHNTQNTKTTKMQPEREGIWQNVWIADDFDDCEDEVLEYFLANDPHEPTA